MAGAKITGTREAFLTMLEERAVYKKLGVTDATVANWKRYAREGKSISLDKMEEMLLKYGATVVQEKVWKINKVHNMKTPEQITDKLLEAIEPYLVNVYSKKMRESLLIAVKEEMQEIETLRNIIKGGGLPAECIAGYQEIKFCPFRQGDGEQCLRCFS